MIWILLYFITFGLIGMLISFRSNDIPVLRSLIAIVLFGILTGIHEIYIFPRLKRFPFIMSGFISSFYYFFNFSLIIVLMSYGSLVYKNSLTWGQAFQIDHNDIFPPYFNLQMLLLYLVISLLNVVRFTNIMIGRGVLSKYASGKYHRPRSEDRIFMFLDLKSSTEIAEKLGHMLYSNFLKDFFNKLDEAILETNGFLFQYVGDEIVMIWNYKEGFEKNNCIRFYFLVKEIIEKSKDEYLEKYGIVPEYKAGVHCGTVSISEIGSMRKSIAYHGDPINTAARICAKCKELDKELLLSENVHRNIQKNNGENFNCIGDYSLRGKKDEISLYSANS